MPFILWPFLVGGTVGAGAGAVGGFAASDGINRLGTLIMLAGLAGSAYVVYRMVK